MPCLCEPLLHHLCRPGALAHRLRWSRSSRDENKHKIPWVATLFLALAAGSSAL